jgi:hypothetical protein
MNFDRYPSRCAPPTVHRGPDPSSPRRLKSAFQGAMRRASAFADAKDNSPVGAGRPLAEGPPGRIHSARRPTVGRRPSCRLKSAFQGAARQASAFADAILRSAQADRWPKASPGRIHSARRPTTGRRPPCRLKSAFQGAARQASAFADAKDNPPVGAGRPSAEGPPRPNSFGMQADRRPKAFVPIEIGPSRRCAPSVGLRRRKRQSSGRRRPTVGRLKGPRPNSFGMQGRKASVPIEIGPPGAARQASAFADAKDNSPVGAGRPSAEGPPRPNSFGAQADHRRPKAFVPIEIGLPRRCTPSVGLRRRKRRSSVGAGRPRAEGLPRPNSFGMQADRRPKAFVPMEIGPSRRCAPSVGLRRRKRQSSGRRRPTVQADRRPKASPGRIHSACRPSGRNCPRLTKSGHIDKDGYRSFPDPLSSS